MHTDKLENLAQDVASRIRAEYLGNRFTAEEFSAWIDNCLIMAAEIEPSRSYYNNRELKKVRQEGLPISMLLRNGFLPAKQIEPSYDEHANFDAIATFADGSEIYIEVTCFKDGQLDLARGEHLEKFGFAGSLGITTERLRQAIVTGVPDIGDAVRTDDTIANCVRGIEDRIAMKLAKNYPQGTTLVVAFEGDFTASTFEAIRSTVVVPRQDKFSKIFLCSYSSKRCGLIL